MFQFDFPLLHYDPQYNPYITSTQSLYGSVGAFGMTLWGYRYLLSKYYKDITPILENQTEKTMENEMETGVKRWFP